MSTKQFYLYGQDASKTIDIDLSTVEDLQSLQGAIAGQYGIVRPEDITFQTDSSELPELSDVQNAEGSIRITIDGHAVREVPGPAGLPFIGSYLEVFPDHLGNNQRLFDKYGPVIKSSNMGKTTYQTNDSDIGMIAMTEGENFSKEINSDHPLFPIKNNEAGVFVGDTSAPAWQLVHKFLPPALGPKAVRHYAPLMNEELRVSFPIFDELSKSGEAWNVYQYMLKLSSGAVGKIVLGKDFKHFESLDAPLHKLPLAIAESLAVNKRMASKGEWYSHLPFGDPKRLKQLQGIIFGEVMESIKNAKSNGTDDLPLQDAALKSADVIDYLQRATDSSGKKLPVEHQIPALVVAAGAGFTTTSSLLSWLIYGLVAYDEMQARLLQELVDNDFDDDTEVTPEIIEKLEFLDKYIKEMQRRHNPSYQPGRTAQRDLILPGGYKISKGSVMIVGIHHIHMNPKIWHDPDSFDPDRWDTDKVKQRKKSDYMPFATGQRMCVGFNFALQEIKIFIVKLVWRYRWLKEGDPDATYDPFFQLIRPINLYVRTMKREKYPSKSGSMMT